MSNVKLDGGKKIIGDKIWEPNGLSTLFLLENGGGKTSVIQLLHQVILPNHDIQGRKLKSIVPKGNTINVAVEWIPDNNSQPMFITGFSFHNYGVKQGKSNTTYDYFNYIVERDTTETLTLETLPFVDNGKIAPYSTLHTFLKEDVNTQVFASNHTYQDALEQYGILASEWRNISKVNGAEAGVTAFFDKADKTQTLIERLLIPAFLDNLFPNEEEKNAIINAFRVYKDRLLELPLLEKNLTDFEVVTKNADGIIDATQNYINIKNELESTQVYLSKLFHTVQNEKEQNQDLILKIRQELSEIEELKKNLQWKIESYKVHLAKLQLNEATRLFNQVSLERDESHSIIQKLEINVKEQKAASHFEDYKDYHRKVLELDGKLHAAGLEVGEQLQELEQSRKRVSGGYKFLLEQQKQKELIVIEKIKNLKKNAKEESQLLKKVKDLITEAEVKKGQLEEFINQYEKESVEVTQAIGEFKKETIEDSYKAVQERITNLNATLLERKSVVKELEDKYSSLNIEVNEKKHEKIDTQRNKEEAEQSFEKFSNVEHELKNNLNRLLSIYARENLFEQQEHIRNKLHRNKEELNKEIIRLSVKIEQVEQIKKSIVQVGFHIHSEIQSIKQFLVSKELYVLSGIEWLLHSTLPQERKEEIVEKNPLLPFSLLIEESEVKEAARALSTFKEELTVPLIFISKQGLEDGLIKGNFIALLQNMYVFHQFNVRFTKEDWERWAVQIEEECVSYQEQRKELQVKEQELQGFENQIKQFWSEYSYDSRQMYSSKIDTLNKNISNLQEEIQKLLETRDHTEEEKEKKKIECETLQGSISDTGKILYRVEDFIKRYVNIVKKREEFVKINNALEKLKDIENDHQTVIDDYEREKEKESSALRNIESRIQEFKRDFKEYDFEANIEPEELSFEEYEKEKYLLKELNMKYSSEKQQLDVFRNSKSEYEDLKEKAINLIEELSYSLEFFKKGNVTFQPALLEQFKEELKEKRQIYSDIQSSYEQLNEALIKKKERYSTEEERIIEVYENNPYEYTTDHQSEYQLLVQENKAIESKEVAKQEEEKNAQQLSFKYENTLTELKTYQEFLVTVPEDNKLLAEGQWIKDNPMKDFHRMRKTFDEKRENLREQDRLIRENIQAMYLEIEQTGNPHLLGMSRDFTNVLESSKGNYEVMIGNFYSVLKAMDKFKESLELQRAQSEEGRDELIEMMFERGELLYKNTCELPKYSQIEEKGLNISLFTIRWPKHDILDCKHKLRMFVDEVLTELTEYQEKGASQEVLDQLFQEKVNDINILNCYADIDRCVLKALKPRNAQLAEMKEYFLWDEVSGWSNGEKHASRMAMFITLNTFIRKKRFSQGETWKFLIADNPFGEASADHVVKPMVVLARKTNTQLFCLTGIEDKRIQMEFDTVISNQYVEQRGRLFLHSETETKEQLEMDSLFYSQQLKLNF